MSVQKNDRLCLRNVNSYLPGDGRDVPLVVHFEERTEGYKAVVIHKTGW